MNGKVVLERALSKLGIASRKETREWILEGRLKVDGIVIKDPSVPVIPEKTSFQLDGKPLVVENKYLIALHKTKGIVTTRKDEKGRKIIYDLLPKHLHQLHPVGRLDMHTTGLLLLTNDTQLSSWLTNPDNKIEREYLVTVRGEITQDKIEKIKRGIEDRGEILQVKEVRLRKISRKESHLVVVLTEGKNREIRRIFEHLGHEVTALKRISFGSIQLGDLPLGEWKDLSREILQLRRFENKTLNS